MQATHNEASWDLTPVLNLLQSISPRPAESTGSSYGKSGLSAALSNGHEEDKDASDKEDEHGVELGNFNKLWKYLGVQAPQKTKPTFESSTPLKSADAYASDGSLYYPASSKSVKWRDEEDGHQLADTQPDSPPSPIISGLTKNQRKNRNRRLRKQGQPIPQASGSAPPASETEEDVPTILRSGKKLKKKTKKTTSSRKEAKNQSATDVSADETPASPLAAKASLTKQTVPAGASLSTPAQAIASTEPAATGQPSPSTMRWLGGARSLMPLPAAALHTRASTTPAQHAEKVEKQTPITDSLAAAMDDIPARPPQAARANSFQTPSRPITSAYLHSLNNTQPRNTMAPTAALFNNPNIPSSAPPKAQARAPTVASIKPPVQTAKLANFPVITSKPNGTRFRHQITPLMRDAEDRNWALLMKLLNHFPADRKHLLSPLQLSINRAQPQGIHVFVDASNILIGFQDHLKRARGIPLEARIEPRVYPDFHALALLLERRRPIAKRVLAGSTPEVAAFEQARQVGYETCILDKVYKAKELTAKQKRIAAKRAGSGYDSGDGGSDGYVTQDAGIPGAKQPKWVEQAVDEILHLKILESIVDTPTSVPASAEAFPERPTKPTMVLATGDAAEAEYSPGFMKMVKRALKAGWNVEVMAWGASVSMDYRKLANRAHWGEQFKIVELDDFAELLFAEATS